MARSRVFGLLAVGLAGWCLAARDGRSQGAVIWHLRDPSFTPTFAVAAPGDVTGDGVPDLVRGNPGMTPWGGAGPGTVTVYSGADGNILYTVSGIATGDAFGASLASLEDLDGDGVQELLVGAPQPGWPPVGAGYARILSGANGAVLQTFTGTAVGDRFGAVDNVGDADGDGIDDLVVGASGGNYARIFSGATGAVLQTIAVAAPFGPLAAVGNADGDGFPDIAVGSGLWSATGTVRLFSGATGALIWSVSGVPNLPYSYDNLGYSIAGPGDVNGDGLGDVLAGAPGAGYARVLSGLNGAAVHTFLSFGLNYFGESVARAGDMNGDGVPDLIVGAPGQDYVASAVYVYSGAGGILFGVFDPYGSAPPVPWNDSWFGRSEAPAGDVSGDGAPDLLVGNQDGVFVFSGGTFPTGTSFPVWGLCPSLAGQFPFIGMIGGLPAVGNATFAVDLSGAPVNVPSVLVLGLGPLSSPVPLPFMACPLFVSPDFMFPRTTSATGTATVSLPIPLDPLLVGAALDFQWYSAYGLSPLPGRMTPTLEITVL